MLETIETTEEKKCTKSRSTQISTSTVKITTVSEIDFDTDIEVNEQPRGDIRSCQTEEEQIEDIERMLLLCAKLSEKCARIINGDELSVCHFEIITLRPNIDSMRVFKAI